VRVTGRERESVHGLAESDDDLMDASEGREGWDGTRSRGSWFSSVDGSRQSDGGGRRDRRRDARSFRARDGGAFGRRAPCPG
jgi:hypothetical protein